MSTDREWEKWGQQDPYFSVLTHPKFRKREMTAEAKEEFFASGRSHVDRVLGACRKFVEPDFNPQRVLDFGCGVGRVALPFATITREVVGVDISEAMLDEARRNCEERGIGNAKFVKSDDALSAVEGTFDLVHTAIVLQHIESGRGTNVFSRLLSRIAPGGLGAIQLTYAKAYHPATLGAPPPPELPRQPEPALVAAAKSTPWVRKLFGRPATIAQPEVKPAPAEPVARAPAQDPEMQMNPYNLNSLCYLLQTSGVTDFHTQFTDHGGELGVFLYFRSRAR